MAPSTAGGGSLGYSGYRWSVVYAKSSTIVTSDQRQKDNISYDLSRYDDLFYRLKPASYTLKDEESGQTHTGLIAQDVENAMNKAGITGLDFAAFVKSECENGWDYGLRYEEFISLCIRQIQKLNERIKKLEEAVKNG